MNHRITVSSEELRNHKPLGLMQLKQFEMQQAIDALIDDSIQRLDAVAEKRKQTEAAIAACDVEHRELYDAFYRYADRYPTALRDRDELFRRDAAIEAKREKLKLVLRELDGWPP